MMRRATGLEILLQDRIRMNRRIFWISAATSVLSALVVGYFILDGWIVPG